MEGISRWSGYLIWCSEIAYFWAEIFWCKSKSQVEKKRMAIEVSKVDLCGQGLFSEIVYRKRNHVIVRLDYLWQSQFVPGVMVLLNRIHSGIKIIHLLEINYKVALDWRFSAAGYPALSPQLTLGGIWRNFWWAQLENCYRHLVDKGQGCCSTSYRAQDDSLQWRMIQSLTEPEGQKNVPLWVRHEPINAFFSLFRNVQSST